MWRTVWEPVSEAGWRRVCVWRTKSQEPVSEQDGGVSVCGDSQEPVSRAGWACLCVSLSVSVFPAVFSPALLTFFL